MPHSRACSRSRGDMRTGTPSWPMSMEMDWWTWSILGRSPHPCGSAAGDGTFSASALTSNIPTVPMLWGDFTGDGRLDPIDETSYTDASSGWTAKVLNELMGQPDATFVLTADDGPTGGALIGANRGATVTGLGLADLNGDGKLDIVFNSWSVAASGTAGLVYTALGQRTGFEVYEKQYGSFGRSGATDDVEIADIDVDGRLDALVNYHTTTSTNMTTYGHAVLLGNGDGTFKDPSPLTLSLPVGTYLWGQIDGDGKVDAVLPNAGGAQVYWNEGGLMFAAGPQVPSPVFGDFDSDGQADFLLSGSSTGSATPGMIVFGDGARGFGRSLATPAINFDVADVNGDGVPDLLSFDPVAGVLSIYVSTAKHPLIGPPDIECTPLPAAQCAGPTGF